MGNTEILEFIQPFIQQADEKHTVAASEPKKTGLYPVATNIATIEASLPGVTSMQQQAAVINVQPAPPPRVQSVDDYLFNVSAEEQQNLRQAPVLATTDTREPLIDISEVKPVAEKPTSVLEQLIALPPAPTHLPALSMFARNQESEALKVEPTAKTEDKIKLSS